MVPGAVTTPRSLRPASTRTHTRSPSAPALAAVPRMEMRTPAASDTNVTGWPDVTSDGGPTAGSTSGSPAATGRRVTQPDSAGAALRSAERTVVAITR